MGFANNDTRLVTFSGQVRREAILVVAIGVTGRRDDIVNRYERSGHPAATCCSRSVWCDHPGQRLREHEGAGRPICTMSCELVLLAGRLCDSPGCAESANP